MWGWLLYHFNKIIRRANASNILHMTMYTMISMTLLTLFHWIYKNSVNFPLVFFYDIFLIWQILIKRCMIKVLFIWMYFYIIFSLVILYGQSTGTFIAASRFGSATPVPPSVLSRGVGWLVLCDSLTLHLFMQLLLKFRLIC